MPRDPEAALPVDPDDEDGRDFEDAADALDELETDDLDEGLEDDEDEDEGEEGEAEGEGGDDEEPQAKKPKKKADDDPDAVLVHKDSKVPPEKKILEALQWAFEGEDIEEELVRRFAVHARMVLEGNKVMNLTAIMDPKEVAAKHFVDSWRVTRLLSMVGRHVMDVGTGAGFPGLPVALAEENARVTLVDSTKKRIDFVQSVIDELGVKNATAVWARGEEHLMRDPCDIVMMRAVSSVRENVRTLRKVRHSHKDLVMFKGSSWSREVRAGEREAERLGYRLNTVWEHELPGEMGGRAILVYTAPGGAGL